jgi:hypothetical protein
VADDPEIEEAERAEGVIFFIKIVFGIIGFFAFIAAIVFFTHLRWDRYGR